MAWSAWFCRTFSTDMRMISAALAVAWLRS